MNKIDVYNHILDTVRPGKGQKITDLKLSSVLNIIQQDFDLYDTKCRELFCPQHFFVFDESLTGEFLVQFTQGEGFIGDMHSFFERFEFIPIKDGEGLVDPN